MILHKEPWFDDIELQIVNGEDIMKSYANNSKVSSCMSNDGRWIRAKFWKYVPNLSMIRAMLDDTLLLRALLWVTTDIESGETVKFLDRVYAKSYPYDYCPSSLQHESYTGIISAFTAKWQEFADVKRTSKQLITEVQLTKELEEYPMTDTFFYLTEDKTKLANHYIHKSYLLQDHSMDRDWVFFQFFR